MPQRVGVAICVDFEVIPMQRGSEDVGGVSRSFCEQSGAIWSDSERWVKLGMKAALEVDLSVQQRRSERSKRSKRGKPSWGRRRRSWEGVCAVGSVGCGWIEVGQNFKEGKVDSDGGRSTNKAIGAVPAIGTA